MGCPGAISLLAFPSSLIVLELSSSTDLDTVFTAVTLISSRLRRDDSSSRDIISRQNAIFGSSPERLQVFVRRPRRPSASSPPSSASSSRSSSASGSLRLPFTDRLISVSPHYYPRQVRVRQHHARPRTIFTVDIMNARGITGILIIIHIHDTIDVPHPRDTKDILTWPT